MRAVRPIMTLQSTQGSRIGRFLVLSGASLVLLGARAEAGSLQLHVRAADLRVQESRTPLPLEKLSGTARRETEAAPRRAVLRCLLAPGEELRQVVAPWPVRVLGTGYDQGYSIAHLEILERDLPASLPEDVTLDLVTAPAATAPVRSLRSNALRDAALRRDVESLVVNPEALSSYFEAQPALAAGVEGSPQVEAGELFAPTSTPSLEGSPVEMLILTRESMAASFQAYADYKTALGTPTVVRTVEWVTQNYPHGADLQETLRGFIREAYQLWGIRYLLLGGDTDQIPARYAASVYTLEKSTVPTDLYYACLDGNWNADGDDKWGEGYTSTDNHSDMADLYPELFVGRLPVVTPLQVTQYLSKLTTYCEPTRLDYQSKLLFLAEVIWPATYKPGDPILKNGADNAERLVVQNGLARPGLTITKMYETPSLYPGSVQLSRQAAVDAMNSGYGLVTHIGHGFRYTMSLGDLSLTNVQAQLLNNTQRPFFINMLNCSAAAFDFPCLAEKLILNPTGGAVGVIGTAREAYPDNVQLYQEAWFQKLFREGYAGAAEALHEARLRWLGQTYDDGAYRWSNFITTYLGDPQLEVWTAAPRQPTVTCTSTLDLNATSTTVQVSADGAAVANATVCLWKAGDFYAVARTNLQGTANLHFRAEAPGSAQLVVSGRGLVPYRGSVDVLGSSTASVHVTGVLQVQDSGSGTSGNGNGVLEASETALLRFEVRNEGGSSAQGVSITAQCTDPGLVVQGASIQVGTIPAGGSLLSQPLSVHVAGNALDQHPVWLDLVLHTAIGWSFNDRVRVDLLQAQPRVTKLTVDDKTTGNGDGWPQANEVYNLVVDVKNYGFGRLDGASASLQSLDPDLTILSGSAALGGVTHLGNVTLTFQVRERIVTEANRILLVLVDSFARPWSFTLETRRPNPPTDLVADPSGGPGIVLLSWKPSPSADLLGYAVYRATRQNGPWSRASLDVIRAATYCRDDGLQGATLYYYNVSAVDSSGNESLRTSTVQLTTNPAQNAGWPQALGQWSESSPVVADLYGDHKLELLASADRVYGWKADGTELLDGDGNAATQGIFSSRGSGFPAGLVAGDLDGDGRDEIVACSWDTREVYVFEGDGSVRAGWPRAIASTTHTIWATPAIGDLDLDGRLEVVVLGLDGRLYAWHADGTEVRDGDQNQATQGVFYVVPNAALWSRGAPVIANILKDDAAPEIVFGAADKRIYMLRANGSTPAGWPVVVGDEVTAAPSLGDIDGDGNLEIAVASRDGNLYVLRGNGANLTGWPRPMQSRWSSFAPSVALADFDHDGKLELVVGGSSGEGADGRLYMFDYLGNTKPGWPVELHTASGSSPIIGDLNSDGVPEIVYGGESGILYGLTKDGTTFPGFPIKVGAEVRATPTLTDLDQDGHVDLVLAGWDQQVYVWHFAGLYVRHNIPWGTFKGNMERTGLYQYQEATDAPPPQADAPPAATRLLANVPNPFNPSTSLRFELGAGEPRRAQLRIYDVTGHQVRTLIDRTLAPGRYAQVWDGRDDAGRPSASGVYLYRLETPAESFSRKMILVK